MNVKNLSRSTEPHAAGIQWIDMGMQVEAVYENGVLKPLRPLALAEHQQVTVFSAFRTVFTVSKEELLKQEAKLKNASGKKKRTKKTA